MRCLLALVCLALAAPAAAQSPEGVSGLDLGSSRLLPISNGDLGSGRVVARFLVSPEQRALLEEGEAAGATRRAGANHVVPARGYSFRGTPVRDGVADCTQPGTACYLVPDDPKGRVLILSRGR